MTLNWTPPAGGVDESLDEDDVMFAVDEDGGEKMAVIADTTRDGAWISVPLAEAHTLSQWR